MSNVAECYDIIVLEWWEAIRRRPGMYIGGTGALGILRIIRDLLDAAQDASAVEIVLQDNTISIQTAATSPSIAPCPRSGVPFLLEACTRLPMPVDEPPTLALSEILDESVNPAEFRRVPQVVPVLAIANALSSDFRVSSISSGIATTFFFSRGRLIRGPESLSTTAPDGLALLFTPDLDIFGDAMPGVHLIAEVARDIVCCTRSTIRVA